VRLKFIVIGVVTGILVSIITGYVENTLVISIPEVRHYGFPLVWRWSLFLQHPDLVYYDFTNFAFNTGFWIVLSLISEFILKKMVKLK
jgi:hypothetical protein